MDIKKRLSGIALGGISLSLFYFSVLTWDCAGHSSCDGIGGSVQAIEINYETDTSDNWSGEDNPDLTINSPGQEVYIPPPPPPRSSH